MEIDSQLVVFGVAIALLSSLIVAVLPVLRLRTEALASSLRDGGRAIAGGSSGRISRWLVAGELALACVVLMSTVVTVRGVESLAQSDLGIDSGNLLTARIALFESAYPDDASVLRFFDGLSQRLREEAGIVSVGAGTTVPGWMSSTERAIPAGFDVGDNGAPEIRYGVVDPGFIDTYKIELRAGRGIEARDDASASGVIVIDQNFANTYFPGRDPLGQQVTWDADGDTPRQLTVIGVTEPLVLDDYDDQDLPNALISMAQEPVRFVSVAMRTRDDPSLFKQRFTEVLRAYDPDTPAYWLRTFDEVLGVALAGERVLSKMFAAFGIVALLLAAAGLYGLIAELVTQRTREIGVQRALGASAGMVLRALMRTTLPQVLIGLGVGIGLAIPFTGLLQNVMPGMPVDNSAWLLLIAILGCVSLIAIGVPARRALAVDPTVALRSE